MMSIYVGNLPYSASEDDLRQYFGQHGEVQRVHLVTDRETGRPRGFAFIEMDDAGGRAAIDALMTQTMRDRQGFTLHPTLSQSEGRRRQNWVTTI